MISKNTILKGVLTIATLAFLVGAVIDLGSLVSFATTTLTSNVVANVVVSPTCFIGLNTPLVVFTLSPTQNTLTLTNSIMDTDSGGDTQATILIAGGTYGQGTWYGTGNWLGTSAANTIGITNTVYGSSGATNYWTAFQDGNKVTNTLTLTTYTIAAPTQSSPSANTVIYLGMGVPGGTPGDTYTTNIVIENSC